jgi:hypothetical protein
MAFVPLLDFSVLAALQACLALVDRRVPFGIVPMKRIPLSPAGLWMLPA